MAVQYELGIGRTREGQPAHEATRARLALYRHRYSPRGVAQRRVISSLSAPASPAGPISLICHAAGSTTGTVLSLDSLTSATIASANSEQESDVLVLSVA